MTKAALFRLRRRLGLTQAQFAAMLACTPSCYARYEQGVIRISPQMERLALCVAHLHDERDPFVERLVRRQRATP